MGKENNNIDKNNKKQKVGVDYGFIKGKSGNPNGRPKGTTNKPKITDYMTQEEIEAVVEQYKKSALKDPRILIHIVEMLMGKPQMSMDLQANMTISSLLDKLKEGYGGTNNKPNRNGKEPAE